jgi:hypothetical protein
MKKENKEEPKIEKRHTMKKKKEKNEKKDGEGEGNENEEKEEKEKQREEFYDYLKEKYIKNFDQFGWPVNLTWNGEDVYQTMFGAITSTILLLVLLGYALFRLSFVVQRSHPVVAITSLARPSTYDGSFSPQNYGFDFAFSLNQQVLDPTIGYFTTRQIKQTINATTKKVSKS